MCRLILCVVLILASQATFPQSVSPETLKSRLADLSPPEKGLPKAPAALGEERRLVESEIYAYRNFGARLEELNAQMESLSRIKGSVAQSVGEIAAADCKTVPIGPFLPASRINELMYNLDRRSNISRSLVDSSPWAGAPWTQDPQAGARAYCETWKRFVGDGERQKQLLGYFDQLLGRLQDDAKRQTEITSQAKQLIDLLQKRREAIDKLLSTQETKSQLSDRLWLAIVAIGAFSIGAILAVKLFSERIQIEWVASGQVIQFVTVMILLSVIMALGLADILKENVLGTLLGGIAGYVLAQGVGRAAAREVTRVHDQPASGTGG